jgi:hypothetical protein
MVRSIAPGQLRAAWVPSISNPAAPTAAELNTGTNLTPQLRRDGFDVPLGGKVVDSSDVSSKLDKTAPGTVGGDVATLKFRLDRTRTTGDAIKAVLTPPSATADGAVGFLVKRAVGGSGNTFAATDRVDVYPAQVASQSDDQISDNDTMSWTATLAITGDPQREVAVV